MATNEVSLRRAAEVPAGGRSFVRAPFRVLTQMKCDVVRICPVGEVTVETVGSILEQIEKSTTRGAEHVVLDMRGARCMHSTVLRLVLDADAASRADGWEFTLVGGPPHVQRVFDLTGSRPRLPFLTASQLAALLTA